MVDVGGARDSGFWAHVRRHAAAAVLVLAFPAHATPAPPALPLKGLPFTRFYAFDEIGDISAGARLSFDAGGRLAAVQDGSFVVLNDNAWIDLAAKGPKAIRIQQAVRDTDGTNYFGSQGACGVLRRGEDGGVMAESFLPDDCPEWATTTSFTQIRCRPEGVYFGGFNGVVFWDRTTRRVAFFQDTGFATLFAIDDRIYVSSHLNGVQLLDRTSGRLTRGDAAFGHLVIDYVARFADGRRLMSTSSRSLLLYAGGKLTEFNGIPREHPDHHVAAMQSLPEGGVAVALAEQGLYVLSPSGEIEVALTTPEYHRINALAINEPGVLWAATENGLVKILYRAPLTWFGQALQLPVAWPQIVPWDGSIVISSAGRFYEPMPASDGSATRFRLLPTQPLAGGWGIAATSDWLLMGNGNGLFGRRKGGPFQQFDATVDASRLAVVGDVCLALGAEQITAFHEEGNTWRECAPPVPAFGYPAIVHAGKYAAWIEIGANRAARVSFRDGRIQTRVFDSFPWPERRWINVSIVDDIVMLSSPGQGMLYFNDRTEQFVEHPDLERLLAHAPIVPTRVVRDAHDTWWLSHEHGVYTMSRDGEGYRVDTSTYRYITDHIPFVHPLPNGDIWISSGSALYRATRPTQPQTTDSFHVALLSVRDVRTGRELLGRDGAPFNSPLPFAENSLALRFFAGSYASRRAPIYEYRLNRDRWTSLEAGSLVQLTDLHEGRYALDVRLADNSALIGTPLSLHFLVAPPWYRTWSAYVMEALFGIALVFAIVRLALRRAHARHAALETLVAERTDELKATMQKLQQETRTAATLAERNRLAGEIHDSLEQGFSGLMLHLETTAGLTQCPPEIRSGLATARSMVAFSRNEVRHAVWDLHSPLLDSGGLEAALRNIVRHLAPEPARARVGVDGEVKPVGSTVEHHLLRIGQEAITNAVKHAAAEHLDIRLVFNAADVCLTVSDDGNGFDPRAVLAKAGSHFGLRSLRSRANKIGAQLEIRSAPGTGTTVTVRMPLVVHAL